MFQQVQEVHVQTDNNYLPSIAAFLAVEDLCRIITKSLKA